MGPKVRHWGWALAPALLLGAASAAEAQDYGGEDQYGGGEYEAGGGIEAGGGFEAGGGMGPAAGTEPVLEEAALPGTGLPLPYAQRPLTLTAGTVRADAAFQIAQLTLSVPDGMGGIISGSETFVSMILGGAYGVMDDLEVGATVLPLLLSPEVDYGDPSVYGIYRFVRGNVDVGGSLAVRFPVQGDFTLTPGLPVLLHIGDNMRLDTGAFLPIVFGEENFATGESETVVSLSLPARFSFNVMPSLFLGGSTGFNLTDMDFDLLAIPLGLHAGYTLPAGGGGPMADLTLEFAFPGFLLPGSEGDVVFTDLWTLTFGANFYFDT